MHRRRDHILDHSLLAAELDSLKLLAESKGMEPGHPIQSTLHAARCELMRPDPSMGYVRNILKRIIP